MIFKWTVTGRETTLLTVRGFLSTVYPVKLTVRLKRRHLRFSISEFQCSFDQK